MRFAPARLVTTFLLTSVACLLSPAARADLVWTPKTGWSIEGGALSGLAGADGRNALDQMNQARDAEEKGSTYGAIWA